MANSVRLRYLGPSDYFEDQQSESVWKRGETVLAVSAEVRDRVTGIPGEQWETANAADEKDAEETDAAAERTAGAPLETVAPITPARSESAPGTPDAALDGDDPAGSAGKGK
jgi:hypothetical protein